MTDTYCFFFLKECQLVPGAASSAWQLPAQHRNSQRAGMDVLVMQHVDCLFGELKRKQAVWSR